MDSKYASQNSPRPRSNSHFNFDETTNYPPPPSYEQYEESVSAQRQQELVSEQQESELFNQTLRWIPERPPAGSGYSTLRRPVVIPRIDVSRMLQIPPPFLRAYSPDLRLHDVNERDFVAFIDNLSVAQAAPAPLQALDIAGKAAGFVPNHWAQIASAGVGVAAGVGTAAVTITRTKRFMQTANQEYFAPRGLKASIVKNKDLARQLGYDENLPQLAPYDIHSSNNALRDRRLKALGPYIAPLSLDVPPPTQQRNLLDRISARQIEQKIKKKEEKEKKKRHKEQHRTEARLDNAQLRSRNLPPGMGSNSAYLSDTSVSSLSSVSSSDEDSLQFDSKIQKINAKADREILKDPRKATKIEHERQKEIQKLIEKKDKSDQKRDSKGSKGEKKMMKRDQKLAKHAMKDAEKGEKARMKDEKKADGMQFIVIEAL